MQHRSTQTIPDDFEASALGHLKKLMKSPAYWRDRDPELVKKVTRGFELLYETPDQDTDLPEARMGQLANILGLNGVKNKRDTKIAHLTPGEIIIPLNHQTPTLMRAIRNQLGDDLATYTIGSGQEQINPESGLPAFAGDSEDICAELNKKYNTKDQLIERYKGDHRAELNKNNVKRVKRIQETLISLRNELINIVEEQRKHGCQTGRIPELPPFI